MLVHVDDFIIMYKDEHGKNISLKNFETFGKLEREIDGLYLGLQIENDGNRVFYLHQEAYIKKTLDDIDMKRDRVPHAPMQPKQLRDIRDDLHNKAEPVMTDNEIRKHIRKLLWILICTRQEIWQTVSTLEAAIGMRSEAVVKVIDRVWR